VDRLKRKAEWADHLLRRDKQHFASELSSLFFRIQTLAHNAVSSRHPDGCFAGGAGMDSLRASDRSWIRMSGKFGFLKDLPGILQEFKISGSVGLAGSGAMTAEIYDRIAVRRDLSG